jgi:aryl-alcohol dehydrogenase-like predicted oxidoreductase
MPRFMGENLIRNRSVVEILRKLSEEKGIRPVQLAIAWVLAKNEGIVPVIGARSRTQLEETLEALAVELSPAELAGIEAAIPAAAGTRYAEQQMRQLDSER